MEAPVSRLTEIYQWLLTKPISPELRKKATVINLMETTREHMEYVLYTIETAKKGNQKPPVLRHIQRGLRRFYRRVKGELL